MKALALAVLALVLVASAPAASQTTAPPSETEVLRKRLQDAGCLDPAAKNVSDAELDAAKQACPDQTPTLRIETGMHTAIVWRIGVDAACRLLATASDDKTIRLWSLPEGKLQRVVRLPIGDGNAGKVYATALSADGRWLAAGGWDATWDKTGKMSLTIVDLSSGEVRRFGAFEGAINHIAYSADGRRVAVGLGSTGVRVLDSASGSELLADRDYGDHVEGLAFAPDGALVASSFDGKLRRYGPDLKLTAKRVAPDGKRPYGVAIDPSGVRVAVGYNDATPVSILDATSLAPLAKAQTDDLRDGNLMTVAWSRDGSTLVAGGRAQAQFQGEWRTFMRRFDASGRRRGVDIEMSSSQTVADIQPCSDGFAFATGELSLGLLSAQGVATILQGPRTADMRAKLGSGLTVSRDASSVRFGLGIGDAKPVLFDLAAASLTDSATLPSGLAPAKIDGLPITDWNDNYAPKFHRAKLALDEYERSHALALRPDASGFALGTEFRVRAYDAKREQRWKHPSPGIAWGVDFSADGEIVVVAYGDGTIRWLRWTDGNEVLALFVEPQSRKWVAWTPSGYYMASAGGEDLIGWHINRGWTQEAEFYPASRFHDRYYRPDIVQAVLKTRDEGKAVALADAERAKQGVAPRPGEPAPGTPARPEQLAAILPPQAMIVSPADGARFSGDSVDVDYRLHAPQGGAIDSLAVEVDGRKVLAQKHLNDGAEGTVTLEAPKRDFVVSLTPTAGALVGAPAKIKLVYAGAAPPPAQPNLYVLALGVDTYENDKEFPRTYAKDDVEELTAALKRQEGVFFGHVEIKPLMDDQVTVDNLRAYFDEIARKAGDNDYVFVYLAGHGWARADGSFYFMTRKADKNHLYSTSLSERDLTDPLSDVPGKKIILLESCHAGAVAESEGEKSPFNMDEVARTFRGRATETFFGAAQGYEFAHFDARWHNHGAFTEELIEGLSGGTARKDGYITVYSLRDYLKEHVSALTDNKQHPMSAQTDDDFPLARITK